MKKDKYGRYIFDDDCTRHRKAWTIEDIRFCMRKDMSRNDIALALGRTSAAISETRRRVNKGEIII